MAVVLPNGVEAAVAIYGILRAGAAFSPLNPTIKREKLAHVLADSGAAAVICDVERAGVVQEAAADAGGVRVIADIEGHIRDGGGSTDSPGQRRPRGRDLHLGVDR